jgi:8-oxo-dGTP diphosphatase
VVTVIANTASVAVVDVANVMGARADGWWRDRAGAALRLCREVIALAERGDETAGAWVLVLEGRAREAVALLENETPLSADTGLSGNTGLPGNTGLSGSTVPPTDWVPPTADEAPTAGGTSPVRLVSAPGSGDDAIVGVVAEATARGESCLVVTADRELRQRCEELNASVVGPGWLLRLL